MKVHQFGQPNWAYIGVSIYPRSSGFISYAALASGIVVFCISMVAARQIQKHLLTNNLLPGKENFNMYPISRDLNNDN